MSLSFASGMRKSFAALLVGLSVVFLGDAALAAPKVFFLSPNGSDSADGSSEKAALHSLKNAVERAAEALSSAGSNEVEIWIDAGRYPAQHVAFTGFPSGKSLFIRANPTAAGRPVFDGDGKGGVWLTLRGKNGVGNVRISGLEIVDYVTAISLSGSRDASGPQIAHVIIRNNIFRRIGQVAFPGGPPAAAAIRLVNAHDVSIINNRFENIRNLTRCSSLHAIYIAHNSMDNLIENNTFKDSCGDPIRFRDGSGNNRVVKNTFINAWAKAPVSDWYCDSDSREDCTKASAECPSLGNIVEGNRIEAAGKSNPPMIMTYGGDQNSACRGKALRSGAPVQRFLVR